MACHHDQYRAPYPLCFLTCDLTFSTQLKFTMIVCYLSTHINVVILTATIFMCNVFIYVMWSRLMSSSRKAKQKYTNPNYTDENDNDN